MQSTDYESGSLGVLPSLGSLTYIFQHLKTEYYVLVVVSANIPHSEYQPPTSQDVKPFQYLAGHLMLHETSYLYLMKYLLTSANFMAMNPLIGIFYCRTGILFQGNVTWDALLRISANRKPSVGRNGGGTLGITTPNICTQNLYSNL